MKVWIELHNGQEHTYHQVDHIDDDRYKITIYGDNGILAILDKGDLKNLISDNDDSEKI